MKARLATMLAATAMLVSGLLGTAPAANAGPTASRAAIAASGAPVITRIDLDYGYDGTVRGGIINYSEDVPSFTQIYLTVSACGRVLHTQTSNGTVKSVSGDSVWYVDGFEKRIDKSMAGPTIEVSASFSDPALPSTSYTAYTHTGYPRSCDALEPADDSNGGSGITVSKWSVKKGATTTAKVGKTLKVTPTRAPGVKVTYAWKVGSKVVDRDRAMTVKKTYRGKKVTMRVTVSKAGVKSVSRVLRYGKAR